MTQQLVEGVDYTINSDGLMVFTSHFLLKRGYCCASGCTNCPYKQNCEDNYDSCEAVKET